jgi:hypothetical protein
MSRRSTRIVLGLVALLGLALLLRRGPREIRPTRTPKPVSVAVTPEPDPPSPVAAAAAEPSPPEPPRLPPPKPVEILPVVPTPAIPPGTVRGTVTILGALPRRKRIKMDADPKCASFHTGDVLSEDIVADPEGHVRWAFVYVARGNTGSAPRGPLPPVLLDQVRCRFEPHVLGVQVDQPLNIYNNDPLLHNVHASTLHSSEFNFGLPKEGLFETKRFTKPEVMVPIVCHIHPWMKAWVGVLDHPYFSVTSETGAYGIVNLPPGRHVVKVWHELYASVEKEVDVPSGGDAKLDFYLDARK